MSYFLDMENRTVIFIVLFLMISLDGEKIRQEDLKVYAFANEGNVWMASTYINVRYEIDGAHLLGILDFAKDMKAALDSIPYVKSALALKEELHIETIKEIPAAGEISKLYLFDKLS